MRATASRAPFRAMRASSTAWCSISPSSDERFSDTVALMDWAYANIAQRSLVNSDQYVEYLGAHVPLVAKVAHNDWVDVAVDATVADPDLTANVFAAFGPVQAKATFNELSGDVHAGDVIGSLVFMQDDNQIAQTDIIAAEDVAAPNFFQGIGVGFDRWIRSIQHQPRWQKRRNAITRRL